jgi:hypothetical protein
LLGTPLAKSIVRRRKAVNLRKAVHIAIAFSATMLAASPSFAGTSAKIQVTATVLPFVKFNAVQHVATYQISSDDIKRGYIDLPDSLTVNVSTNVNGAVPVVVDNGGYGRVLVKESGTGDFSGSSFTLNTAGYRPNTLISKNFDSRVILPANSKEGVYPLTISMMPAI